MSQSSWLNLNHLLSQSWTWIKFETGLRNEPATMMKVTITNVNEIFTFQNCSFHHSMNRIKFQLQRTTDRSTKFMNQISFRKNSNRIGSRREKRHTKNERTKMEQNVIESKLITTWCFRIYYFVAIWSIEDKQCSPNYATPFLRITNFIIEPPYSEYVCVFVNRAFITTISLPMPKLVGEA